MASDEESTLDDLLGRVSKKLGWQNLQPKESKSTSGIGKVNKTSENVREEHQLISENAKHSHKKKKKQVPRSLRKDTGKSRRDISSSSDKENCSINVRGQEHSSKKHQAQERELVRGDAKRPLISTAETKKNLKSIGVEENDLELSSNLSIDSSSPISMKPAPYLQNNLRCSEGTEAPRKEQQRSSPTRDGYQDQSSSDEKVPEAVKPKNYSNDTVLSKLDLNYQEWTGTDDALPKNNSPSSMLDELIEAQQELLKKVVLGAEKSREMFEVISLSDSDSCDSNRSTKATDEVLTPISKRNDSGFEVPFSPLQSYSDTSEPIKWLLTPTKDSPSKVKKLPVVKFPTVTFSSSDKDSSSDPDVPALSLTQRLAKNFKKQNKCEPVTDGGRRIKNSHFKGADSGSIDLARTTEKFPVVKPRNLQTRCPGLDSDDSDDDFEHFLQAIKTPQHTTQPHQPSIRFVDNDQYDNSFIDDAPVESKDCDDDDVFYYKQINSDRKFVNRKPKVQNKEKSSTLSDFRMPKFIDSDDSDDGVFDTPRLPKKTKPKQATTLPKKFTPAAREKHYLGRATPSSNRHVDFLCSLSTPRIGSRSSSPYVNEFKKHREVLTRKLFTIYNQTVFDNKLPSDFNIKWNNRMRKTAGYCYYSKTRLGGQHFARIELSEKVCDTAERLRDTLVHELCHAACWVINGVNDGHGRFWKYWAAKANRAHPSLPIIKRCHSYEITTKFKYQCITCKTTIGRHSKSINTSKFCCAVCKGNLVLLPSLNKDGTVNKLRTPNKFAMFVKENYGSVKKENSAMKHADIMRHLSKDFSRKASISV